MDFWKPNEEVDKLQLQVLSEEKQALSIEDVDTSGGRPSMHAKNFSKQKMVMEVPEEAVVTRINAVMDRKER